MEQVTPPQRTSRLAEIPSPDYREALSTPNLTLNTPTARLEPPPRKQSWSGMENSRDAPQQDARFRPSDSIVPSTPHTSLESNDGSTIKTPFGDLGLWNATSPGIADTPTPAGAQDIRHAGRDILRPVGAASELVTPDFPSNPAQFGARARGLESPLAAKTRPSETQHKKLLISAIVSPSGGMSPDDSPIKPLKFSASHEVLKGPINEPAQAEGTAMDEPKPVQNAEVDAAMSDAITADTNPSEEVESVRSAQTFHPPTPPPVPQSIRRWLESSSSKGAEARAALRSSRRKDSLECTQRRLAQFTQPQTKSLSRLESYSHEHAGRVLQPHGNDADYYGIVALHECPDDLYPWSITQPAADTKQTQTRLKELEMVERYLEDTTSSSEDEPTSSPPPKTDPANAMVALRAKKVSRRWLQQRTAAAKAAVKAASLQVPQVSPRKTTRAPVVTPPPKAASSVESDMDVDKDSEDVVACICKGPDDGRPMIQCDNCHSWLHVECVIREEERNQLPDKWYCWKCPVGTAPDRVSTNVQPIFVASTPEYPKDARRDTAADVPVYQASDQQQASPDLGSYAPRAEAATSSSSLLDPASNPSSFSERTPPPLSKDWPRYGYSVWSESGTDMARHSNDRLDDPMTAIASTPFIGSGFASTYGAPFDDAPFDQLNSSPNRNFGLRFPPPTSASPRKERPWTNYIGSFATPTNPTGPQLSPGAAQALPIVQTDPLFIHYEHDAPKQTAHHHGRSKRKGKSKEETQSEKGEDGAGQVPPDSAESSNTDDIGPFSDSGTADASTPVGSSHE